MAAPSKRVVYFSPALMCRPMSAPFCFAKPRDGSTADDSLWQSMCFFPPNSTHTIHTVCVQCDGYPPTLPLSLSSLRLLVLFASIESAQNGGLWENGRTTSGDTIHWRIYLFLSLSLRSILLGKTLLTSVICTSPEILAWKEEEKKENPSPCCLKWERERAEGKDGTDGPRDLLKHTAGSLGFRQPEGERPTSGGSPKHNTQAGFFFLSLSILPTKWRVSPFWITGLHLFPLYHHRGVLYTTTGIDWIVTYLIRTGMNQLGHVCVCVCVYGWLSCVYVCTFCSDGDETVAFPSFPPHTHRDTSVPLSSTVTRGGLNTVRPIRYCCGSQTERRLSWTKEGKERLLNGAQNKSSQSPGGQCAGWHAELVQGLNVLLIEKISLSLTLFLSIYLSFLVENRRSSLF